MEETQIEIIETTDAHFIAYLMAIGIRPISYKVKDGHIWWSLKKNSELEKAKVKYYNNEALVDAQTICDCLRKVKVFIKEMGGRR
jgi:hypothetical protein